MAVWQNGQIGFVIWLLASILVAVACGLVVLYCEFGGIFGKCVEWILNASVVGCFEFAV